MKQMSLTPNGFGGFRLTRKLDHIQHHFTFNTEQEMREAHALMGEALTQDPELLLNKVREAEKLVAQYDEELARLQEANAGLQDTVEKLTERQARIEAAS